MRVWEQGRPGVDALLGRPRLLVVAVAALVAAPVLIVGQASENDTRARLAAAQVESAAHAAEVVSSDFNDRTALIGNTLAALAAEPRPAASPIGLAVQRGDVATLQALADSVQLLYPRSVLRVYITVRGRADTIGNGTIVAAAPAGTGLVGKRRSDLTPRAGAIPDLRPVFTAVGFSDAYPGTPNAPSRLVISATVAEPGSESSTGFTSFASAMIEAEVDLARTFAEFAAPFLVGADDAYLLSGRRQLIGRARGPTAFPLRDLSADPFVQLVGPPSYAVARAGAADPLGGGTRLIASAGLSGSQWSILVLRDTSVADRETDTVLGQLAIARYGLVALLLLGVALIAQAASVQIRQRRELGAANAQLREATAAKSRFLANMSHELRTPLNAVIGFSDVLEQRMVGELNDKQAEYVRDISSSGKHLLDLVNEILDLSKVEAGRMELEPSEFALAETVGGALAFVRERAAGHGIELASDLASDLGMVVADERKVRQVLLNLLSNAVKFTPDGGWIGVSARRADGEVQVSVRDTGIGIAPEDLPKVFEEFRQVGKASDRSREGTGLGLTLAKKFIELHGGRIWLESEVGKGTTFTFALPAGRTAAAPA